MLLNDRFVGTASWNFSHTQKQIDLTVWRTSSDEHTSITKTIFIARHSILDRDLVNVTVAIAVVHEETEIPKRDKKQSTSLLSINHKSSFDRTWSSVSTRFLTLSSFISVKFKFWSQFFKLIVVFESTPVCFLSDKLLTVDKSLQLNKIKIKWEKILLLCCLLRSNHFFWKNQF